MTAGIRSWFVVGLFSSLILGCGSTSEGAAGAGGGGGVGGGGGTGGTAIPDYTMPGPEDVGVVTTSLTDDSRQRTLAVEVWYPTSMPGNSADILPVSGISGHY